MQPYLSSHKLHSILVEGWDAADPGEDNLMELFVSVRLEGHAGQTLEPGEGGGRLSGLNERHFNIRAGGEVSHQT